MQGREIEIYEFGSYRLDVIARCLLRDGQAVPLTHKIFNILLLLVKNSSRVVTKEELMREVWPHQFVEDNNLTVSISALRKVLGKTTEGHQYIETIPRFGYRFVARVREMAKRGVETREVGSGGAGIGTEGSSRDETINSLAVLPLVNMGDDPDLEYLSDGITEAVINILSQLPGLMVMSRNTVFRYKGKEVDAREVGQTLNVQAVLLWRVLQFSDNLVIRAELVKVRDGTQLWGEQYNRRLSDILVMQEEIAREVSEQLQLKLTERQRIQLAKRYTENTEAYHLYLKGRYLWNKFSGEWVKKSINYYQQAIELDSNYALAYAGLADSYLRLSAMYLSPKEALPKAKESAIKAVEIDSTLSDAHASLGLVKLWHDHDWSGAEKEYKLAINLNPATTIAHKEYAKYFMFLGRFDEALAEHKLALELDPLALQLYVDLGATLFMMRQYSQAIEQFHKALEMAPRYYPARFALAWGYIKSGDFRAAFAELDQIWQLGEDSYLALGLMGHAHAVSGNRVAAENVIEKLKVLAKREYITPYSMVLVHIGLGDKEATLEWLEKLYEDRGYWLVWLKIAPELDELRAIPQFVRLLRRVGFNVELPARQESAAKNEMD